MRTLLRDTANGLYLQGPDKWTDDPLSAFDFKFMDRALRYVETWHLDKVELAFAFDEPAQAAAVTLGMAALQIATF